MRCEPGEVPWIVVIPLSSLDLPVLDHLARKALFVRSSYGFLKTLYASLPSDCPRFL